MVNGIINVYKEKGYTSFDVVAKLRGIFKQKKIGHTGTLDPDAEGVLPVCLGKATKVCDLLTDKSKEYEAVLLLGKVTDTQDITGTDDGCPFRESFRENRCCVGMRRSFFICCRCGPYGNGRRNMETAVTVHCGQ